MVVIYITAFTLLLAAGGFVTLFLAMFRHASGLDLPDGVWLDDFSIERYQPLQRLFDTADLEFVASQRGYTPSLGRKLAAARRAAARMYLSELALDFDKLFRAGRAMLVHSREDRPDLASALVKRWLVFHMRVIGLRLQLRLAPLGVAPARPGELIEALRRMQNAVALQSAPA